MVMDYYGKYKNIIQDNSTDSVISTNKEMVNDNFNQAFFTESVIINGTEHQVIVKQEKKSEDKKLIFKPDTKIDIGSVVKISDVDYLVSDFLGEGINEIYPTAKLKLCNATYPIKSNKTSVLVGRDNLGKPIKKDIYEIEFDDPCIVEMGNVSIDTNKQLVIPENKLYITLKYQPSLTFELDYPFEMYGVKYKVLNVDYTKVIKNKGIIKILAERA